MPYMKREDFKEWLNHVDNVLRHANCKENTIYGFIHNTEPMYYLGYCGAKHKITVYYGNMILAVGIRRINQLLEKLEQKYGRIH